jgi:hypothetical protein
LDGNSLKIIWNRWAFVGGLPGKRIDVGLSCEVNFHIEGQTLLREEIIRAEKEMNISEWKLVVPTTYSRMETQGDKNSRIDRFFSPEGSLIIKSTTNLPVSTTILASGDSALGRGVKGAIPLHLVYEAKKIIASPHHPLHFQLSLSLSP